MFYDFQVMRFVEQVKKATYIPCNFSIHNAKLLPNRHLFKVSIEEYSLVNVMPRFASTRNERKFNFESIEDINLKLRAIINHGPDEVHCKCRRGSPKTTPALAKQDPEEVRKENFVQIFCKSTRLMLL
uniref:Uncharacterized protein n=1 Tax=Glossina pallidipes TaxID=7398 RepID=A0A1A9ZFZ4_GLOPL